MTKQEEEGLETLPEDRRWRCKGGRPLALHQWRSCISHYVKNSRCTSVVTDDSHAHSYEWCSMIKYAFETLLQRLLINDCGATSLRRSQDRPIARSILTAPYHCHFSYSFLI